MSVLISSVIPKSPADKKGIRSNDVLLSINSHEINDVLDYQFYLQEKKLVIEYLDADKKKKKTTIRKSEFDDIGLEFETYLMDKQIRCKNKCVFCFIDQLPEGMRETLYFKDDDSRLSFLFGNYVTLTNLTERDVERIIEMHISPVNVSVHTMNPELRVRMMKNKNAGSSLSILKRLSDAGIKLNTQLVLCPGFNDGKELEYSLTELERLFPALQSIAAVPVGLTKYRECLEQISEFTEKQAKETIEIINRFGDVFKEKYGSRIVYAADEFYLKANIPMPDEGYYEDYPQIENGVGLWKSLESEFDNALETCDYKDDYVSEVSMATGVAAYPLIKSFSEKVMNRFKNVKINVFCIENEFFGKSITVAGLITGKDLINQLMNEKLYKRLIIPSVMLRSEQDMFLDNVTTEEVEEQLSVKLDVSTNDGYELLDLIMKGE